jgi:hypothetical protein
MRSGGIILGALVILAVCSMASATLDAKAYTLCEKNISINLTPNFRIIPDQGSIDSPGGVFIQGFSIIGTGLKGEAMLVTMDVYDENMKALGTEAISQRFSGAMAFAFSSLSYSERDNIIGNWSMVDNKGENVTINTMDTKGTPLSILGDKADMAFWNIEDSKYAFLISSFDKDVIRQIINTLEIN